MNKIKFINFFFIFFSNDIEGEMTPSGPCGD